MRPEQFERLKQLVLEAGELPAWAQLAFLAHACADDPDLRAEAEALLAPGREAFLEEPTVPACREPITEAGLRAGEGTTSDGPSPGLTPPPGQAAPPPGDRPRLPQLSGYEIVGELGHGAMGIVYRAWDLKLRRHVALKILRRVHPEEKDLARFRTEAQALACLQHPNIVQVYQVDEQDGLPFFSMELVDGNSLARRLQGPPLPPGEAARLAKTLAGAIQAAHERRVIHRDLKPANVLLAADGTPKIADFGLAKKLDDQGPTVSGDIMGTPPYMAPEQARGDHQKVDHRADVYALGVILYECLAGRPPFVGETAMKILDQVLHDDPTPPSQFRPGTPPDLEAVCLKCLQKEPDQRYQGAEELADDLRRFLDGEPLSVRPESEWDRQARWALRAGYELLELIGCSSVGLVYRANQVRLGGRPVILKTVSAQERLGPDQVERFRAEAQVAARLSHPNIAQIYDFGECQGRPYFSLEYVDGGRVSARCRGEPQPPREAAALIAALAEAAHCAHARGIVHGDLRPFNVLLTAAGVPKITGFGLGRLFADGRPDPSKGRPRRILSNYMAPEQAAGRHQDVGPAADVHALGAMFYEMLTGVPPFLADTIEETLDRIALRQAVPLRELHPDVPSRLQTICLRCLEKDPRQRYPSARELADDLQRWLRRDNTETDDFDLVPGYELIRELGKGGMGVVYEARQVKLDRRVALKIFHQGMNHVVTSIRAAARLQHPNLVQVFDCGERDGLLYVAEELVDGSTLAQHLAGKPQPPREAAALLETLARVLHHAHSHGLVHRNLKPNVVLLPAAEGVPKVGSFDLAVLPGREGGEESAHAPSGVILGTVAYMAPEQLSGDVRQITPATDVWALGAILYEMLTGVIWRTSPLGPETLFVQVQRHEPEPPGRLQPGVPRPLEGICLKCLQKDPAHRYATAGDLADDLRRFLEGRQLRPDGPGFWQRLLRWFGRRLLAAEQAKRPQTS